tara:strand:- start:7264 stop:7578 length:315 start_codon:yes stop_codon:yes gene_type:complete
MRRFHNTHYGDDTVAKAFQDVEDAFVSLEEVPLLNGRLLKDLEFKGSTTLRVSHGLGRAFNGYIVVSTNEKVVLKIVDSENLDPLSYIPLQTNTYDATISLWVF